MPESWEASGGYAVLRPEALNGTALMRWGRLCLDELANRREEINALNVFPVADADTGTNLLATMRAAVSCAEVAVLSAHGGAFPGGHGQPHAWSRDREPAVGVPATQSLWRDVVDAVRAKAAPGGSDGPPNGTAPVAGQLHAPAAGRSGVLEPDGGVPAALVTAAMARGATAGARGNSGIILSQVLRGIAEATRSAALDGDTARTALRRAAVLVREALSVPVEGTILTVLERAAGAAADCPDDELAEIVSAAADGAAEALGETTAQLTVLQSAGVVDAGARGLVVLLDSLVEVVTGRRPERPVYRPAADPPERRVQATSTPPARYEVMYRLDDSDPDRISALRYRLTELGDSVVVVGDGADSWSAHVHCVDAGAAIEAGIAAGTLSGVRVESFAIAGECGDLRAPGCADHGDPEVGEFDGRFIDGVGGTHTAPEPTREAMNIVAGQHVSTRTDSGPESVGGAGPADRAIVAVAAGHGAMTLFRDAGAEVVPGEPTVTTAALLAAIRRLPHREVLVLPNGALPAQELVAVGVAARDNHRDVLLLPSGSMVQGLAALAVHDAGRIAVDDAFAMSEAAAATRWGSLRAATERALTMVGTCEPGDGLGLVGHDVIVIDRDVRAAGQTLLDRMLGLGGELVTLLVGAAAPEGLAQELSDHVAAGFPGVEIMVYSGGQHADLIQIGVE
ncbi:DAK2 domain-containing protein [Nocardia cyriacigeorgica]|uniref:DAK2 domain-containing protein n=1 Tax=Nocardia cyriacigeorgica TaxID=135487 RepID=UPI003EDFA8AA